MNRKELIRRVASHEALGVPEHVVHMVTEGVIEEIRSALLAGEDITIQNLGTFRHVTRKPKFVRNVKTGEVFYTEARTAIVFKPSKKIR